MSFGYSYYGFIFPGLFLDYCLDASKVLYVLGSYLNYLSKYVYYLTQIQGLIDKHAFKHRDKLYE